MTFTSFFGLYRQLEQQNKTILQKSQLQKTIEKKQKQKQIQKYTYVYYGMNRFSIIKR